MQTKYLFIAAILGLTSCNSFNTIKVDNTNINLPAATVSAATKASEVLVSVPLIVRERSQPAIARTVTYAVCPKFVFPNIPPIPPVPLDELRRINASDQGKMDAVMVRHMMELRKYIKATRETMLLSKKNYQDNCIRYEQDVRGRDKNTH